MTNASTFGPIAASCWLGVSPPVEEPATPAATWSFSAEMRTWKNSSRLDEQIATNFSRSSSGMPGLVGQGKHASVEVEPTQLPVEQSV